MSGRGIALVALLIAAADRASKLWVMETLPVGGEIRTLPGFFSLVHYRNEGAAFGMFSDLESPMREIFLIGVAALCVIALIWFIRDTPPEERAQRFAAGAIIGGALGNLYDRLAYGNVVDFLDFYWNGYHWPAFNVADSFITCGAILLVVASIFSEVAERRSEPDPG